MIDPLGPAFRRHPDRPALAWEGGAWTFGRLDEEVEARARELWEAGAGPGRRVALRVPPGAPAVVALLGTLRTGAVVAPLHPKLTGREEGEALQVLQPHLVAIPGDDVEASLAVESGPGAGSPGSSTPSHGLRAAVWSSGTSGRRRAVALTARALQTVAEGSATRLGLGPGDRWLVSLSPAHVGGLALVVRAVLLGSCLVARERVDPAELADLLDRGEVTHASLVPVMLRRLLAARSGGAPRPGGCLLVGGAHAPPELVERAAEAGLPVALTYGLSEASSQVATAPPELVRRKPGTVGHPLPGVELRLGPGGEIRVRGPTVSPGYLAPGPEGAPVLEPVAGPDGWLSTGDLGSVDEEGHLRVRGRRSARIVSGGVTVDPGEVERVLREHPRVAEAAVVGLPDETWGERVAALVVPTGPLEESELDRWARARLSPGWIPRRYRFREALPRNATGKVDREAVRAGLAR